jgi:hypothetical protein
LTGIDNAKNFAKIGGIFFLLNHAINCDIPDELREQSLIILTDCSANNEFVHKYLTQAEFWLVLNTIESSSDRIRLRVVSFLASVL